MSPAPPHTPCHDVETPPPPSSSLLSDANLRFPHLRGVLWRVNLGILPSSSVDDLRRVTADSRRRYAGLRRHLLVDPHLPKDGSTSPDLVMDNPLSQNPDSTWGRFFRNAELERMVDQDLSRLYPEHGSFFQTLGCQGMLRRILLLWCLRHPECGYRQGMHELLAPLLYVLHVDVEHLNEVRKLYEDHFTDRFDELSFQENDITYNFDFKKSLDSREDDNGPEGISKKARSLTELDPEIQTVVLLSDAYGAEGELGIVLSEKFMEHDAFCMFDSLMKGAHGSVAMADFFTPSPTAGSHSGLPPVIEASAALYHVLSFADSSLHSHLVELGVEPQYFALRWLRVLFGREFALPDLLIIWDEIFSAENSKLDKGTENDRSSCFRIINSPRGTLIIAIAVSMMLYIRSSLLATENAASCLQRLLNFPENINLRKLIDTAKALQVLASSPSVLLASYSFDGVYNNSRPFRVPGPASDAISPRTPLSAVPDSYWEEKWRVLHKAEELRQGSLEKQSHTQKKGWSEKVKLRLSRTSSDPSPAKTKSYGKAQSSSARRSLLEDLSQQLGLEEETDNKSGEDLSDQKHCNFVEVEVDGQNAARQEFTCAAEETCVSGDVTGEDNSSMFSGTASPASAVNDAEKDSERSSIASNSSVDESYDPLQTTPKDLPLPVSQHADVAIPDSPCHDDCVGKTGAILRERKLLSGKFQWFWKFGRNTINEEMSEKGVGNSEAAISTNGDSKSNATGSSVVSVPRNTSSTSKGDAVDQNVMVTLKNLGQSMLEHIQVLESVFQQDRGQAASLDFSKSVLVGRGQVTAMTALKELRKISNLLSEM